MSGPRRGDDVNQDARRRLHPWTRDPGSVAMVLRRRGTPGTPERDLWERVLSAAVDLDDLAADLALASERVPLLVGTVRDLLARLPESRVSPRLVPLVLLDAIADTTTSVEAAAALADWLAEAAERLAQLAGAPVARNPDALAGEVTDVLNGLEPMLAAWAERIAERPETPPVVALPAPEPEPARGLDDRY